MGRITGARIVFRTLLGWALTRDHLFITSLFPVSAVWLSVALLLPAVRRSSS